MSSDEARVEAEALSWAEYRNEVAPNPRHAGREAVAFKAGFDAGAGWQAERDAEGIKRRGAEVGEDEGWWVGGAWGDYGEAVVPLRILSYVVDGKLDEKVASIDPGFALTYAEQTARAGAAEAKIAAVRAIVEAPPPMFGRPLDQWVDDLLVSLRAALAGAVTDE